MAGTASDPFFWNDWLADPCVRACSRAARSVWMDMLCLMAQSTEKGMLLINGKKPSMATLSRIFGDPVGDLEPLIEELGLNGVYSKDRRGVIYSRAMLKRSRARDNSSKGGKIGGRTTFEKQKGIFSTQEGTQDATHGATQHPRRAPLPFPSPSLQDGEIEIHPDREVGPSSSTTTDAIFDEDVVVHDHSKDVTMSEERREIVARETPTVKIDRTASRGVRWHADAVVTEEWRQQAAQKRGEAKLPPLNIDLEAERFANYWAAKSGSGATKVDWLRTWINWVLNAKGSNNGNTARQSAHDGLINAGRRALEILDREREGAD
jgi:hypothetical protein